MSTAAMKSSPASASSRRAPSGVESTGLPERVSIARIWPSPGRLDLLAQRGDRELAADSGSPRTRVRQASWWPRPMSAAPDDVDGRAGEHRAALAVEVAGEELSSVDRPLADRAELLRGDAHAAVGRRRSRRRRSSRAMRRIVVGRRRRSSRSARSGVKSATAASTASSAVGVRGSGWRARPRRARGPSRAGPTRRCPGARSGARWRSWRSRCGAGRARPSVRRGA